MKALFQTGSNGHVSGAPEKRFSYQETAPMSSVHCHAKQPLSEALPHLEFLRYVPGDRRKEEPAMIITTAEWSAPSLETVRENGTNQPVRSGSKTWTTVEDALTSAKIIKGARR